MEPYLSRQISRFLSAITVNAVAEYPYMSTFRLVYWIERFFRFALFFFFSIPVVLVTQLLKGTNLAPMLVTFFLLLLSAVFGQIWFSPRSKEAWLLGETNLQRIAVKYSILTPKKILRPQRLKGNLAAWKTTIEELDRRLKKKGITFSDDHNASSAAQSLVPLLAGELVLLVLLFLAGAFANEIANVGVLNVIVFGFVFLVAWLGYSWILGLFVSEWIRKFWLVP